MAKKTVDEILRQDKRTLTPEEKRSDTQYLRRQMQKRVDRLRGYEKAYGITSPALDNLRDKGLVDNYRIKDTRNMTDKGISELYDALRSFGQSATSRISTFDGVEGFYENRIERPIQQMRDYGITGEITPKEASDFWREVNAAKEAAERQGARFGVYRRDSDPIVKEVAERWGANLDVSAETVINRIREVRSAFEETEEIEVDEFEELPF